MQFLYTITTLLIAFLITIFAKNSFVAFSPARIFTYFWTFQIIFMVVLWYDYLLFSYSGLIYILFCIISFDIGAFVVSSQKTSTIPLTKRVYYNEKYVNAIYIAVLGISLFGTIYGTLEKGFSLQTLLNLESFLEMSNQNSIDRYSGEEEAGGVIGKIIAINNYACPLVGGMLFFYFKKKIYSVLSLVPLFFNGLAQGVKMGIITGTFLWLIGIIISLQIFDKKLRIKMKHYILSIFICLSFFLLLIISMMFRIGRFDLDTFEIASAKFVSYSLGHLPAFDMWFNKMDPESIDYTFGGKLFYGITNYLGILERKQGVFSEMYVISKGGDSTNVFTVFRLIIEDFGFFFTIPFMFIMGVITHKIYHYFLKKKNIALGVALMSAIYFFISWSFVTSVFAYTTYIVMFIYAYIICKFLILKK